MWNIKNGRFYLIFSVMGLLISLSICIVMYFQFDRLVKDSYFGTLTNVALMVEKQYPILYDINSMKKGLLKNENWIWNIHDEWIKVRNAFDLAYIYYMERTPEGEYLEIMDTYYTRDMDIRWLGSEVWEDDPIPEGVDEAWDAQKMTFSPRPSVEEAWGVLVSIYFPIVKNGQTIGILGVDYDISYVKALENRVFVFLIISFAAATVLTGILAFIGSRSVIVTIEEREKIIREAVERQAEIERLMHALKQSSETRTSFLSNISNAMSDPINNIIRISLALSKYTEITEEHQKNLEIINDEGIKLYDVIHDVLDILKIDSGKLKINYAKYDVVSFISDTISQFSILKDNKLIEHRLIVDEKLPVELLGDERRIKQICYHVLTNAFKYTREGCITVNVTCRSKVGYVLLIIKITDTGIGMTEDKVSNIFINYGQGAGGLGLYVCKQLAEMMKGTLSVTSEHGKGSVFTLSVPQKLMSSKTIGFETARKLASFNVS